MTESFPATAAASPSVPVQGAAMVCLTCGAVAPSNPPPLTWSAAVENGRRVWTCETCMRENLRSIESKLDSAWW